MSAKKNGLGETFGVSELTPKTPGPLASADLHGMWHESMAGIQHKGASSVVRACHVVGSCQVRQ